MTKPTIILIGAIAIAGPTATLLIQHQAQVKLRENDSRLRQQESQVVELMAEQQRLSNRVLRRFTDQLCPIDMTNLSKTCPGPYYVDATCIDCDLCRNAAPQFLTRYDEG